jgi:hypothetical protein
VKKHTNHKRLRKARGALKEMMDMLRPYLPGKQSVPPEQVQKWQLPEDRYGTPGQKDQCNPTTR